MGRSPCCEKVGLKKGPWTPEEDQKLLAYIEENGHGSWRALPAKAGLQRCGKSCRLRWTNYLRPDIKRGKFSLQEEQTIIQLHALLGNRWSAIATHLPKRTDNEIKNYWNTHLKKRLAKMGIDPVTHKPKSDALSSADGHTKNAANLSHMAQWESARLEAEARLVRESKLRPSAASTNSTTTVTAAGALQAQHLQLGSSSGMAASAELQPAPQPCLDVLRAWQGVWSKSAKGGRIDLESPTSTLSFSENGMPSSNLGNFVEHSSAMSRRGGSGGGVGGEGGEEVEAEEVALDWKCFGKSMRMMETKDRVETYSEFPMESSIFGAEAPWLHESLKQGSSGLATGNYGDGFTEMLLENSDEQNSSSDGCADSGNAVSGGGGHDNEEENKSYWNSILNLVNSASPCGSPPLF